LHELHPKHFAPRQSVVGNGLAFDTPHDPGGKKEPDEVCRREDKILGVAIRPVKQYAQAHVAGFDQCDDNRQEDQ